MANAPIQPSATALVEVPHGPAGITAHSGRSTVNAALAYAASLQPGQSRDTAVAACRRMLTFLYALRPAQAGGTEHDWDGYPWHELGPVDTLYLHRRLLDTFKPATARVTLSILRGVLRSAWRLGQLDSDVYQRAVDLPKVKGKSARAGRMLDPKELATLTTYLHKIPGSYGAMVRALFALGLGGGFRRAELATMRVDALSADGRTLRVIGKGNKERDQPLAPWVAGRVRAWVEARGDVEGVSTLFLYARGDELLAAPPTLKSTWGVIIGVTAAAGRRCSTHDLRRTFASRLFEKGDTSLVQRAMAHESAATTVLYDRRDDRRVGELVDGLEGYGFEKEHDMPKTKTIDVPKPGLATLGELAKAKGPKLTKGTCDYCSRSAPCRVHTPERLAEDQKEAAPSATMTKDAASDGSSLQTKSLTPPVRKIKVNGQTLVEAPRGRIVRPPQFRRNGVALDVHWATGQAQRLVAAGKSHEVVCAALMKVGVRRADGSDLQVADVTKLL